MGWSALTSLVSGVLAIAASALGAVGPLVVPTSASVGQDDDVAFFENDVRPLLAAHCAECHGGLFPEAELDLESSAGLGAARAIAGLLDGADAKLVRAVRYDDPHLRMPPDGRLDEGAIATLVAWAEAGAPVPDWEADGAAASALAEAFDLEARRDAHWAWQQVTDPTAPTIDGPLAERVRDPLDAFLFAAMAEQGLEPAGPARKGAWLRRVTYAVTGLPPTVGELVAFEQDAAPDARERVVDRLLESPRYGERWARHWLDLVRYAETKAHEFDFPIPNAHAYRDYVIRAFDADVSYDRFVKEHIAGDLLAVADEGPRLDPSGTFDESVLATGWWYLHEDVHSPVDSRADECDRLANQVDTLSKSMLGMTVACARCHDHKFDAISAEDYHALAGFALSTGYAQVRYETDAIERDVARRLQDLDARLGRDRSRIVHELHSYDREWLEATIYEARALRAAWIAGEGESSLGPGMELAPWMAVVLEDFEDGDWGDGGGPLRPWHVEGDAFGDGPVSAIDCPTWHGVEGMHGTRFVNSHAGHSAADAGAGDRPTGTLTSAPFTVTHRYVHFFVSGGDNDSTQVRLERRTGGEWDVVRTATGHRSNAYRARRFELGDLLGETVRLVVVDEASGGWGHIGLDRIVASDSPRPEHLERARSHDAWARLVALSVERHPDSSVGEHRARMRIAGWDPSESADDRRPVRGDPSSVAVDYTTRRPLIQNGHAFRPSYSIQIGSDGSLSSEPFVFASAEPEFGRLRGVGERHGGSMAHEQAGRTLVTPTLELTGDSLWYLVRGRGRAYVAIDSHRTVSGPLYADALLDFDTAGEWRWVEHPLGGYEGSRARVELTATGSVLALDVAGVDVSSSEGGAPRSIDSFVDLDRLGDSNSDMDLNVWLDAGRADELRERIDAYRAERERVLADLPTTSRLAPAALELEGRDERVLRRGDHRSPGAPAPRRDLAAVRTSDEPLAVNGAGSGRLELARAWTDPSHPLVARVWVNRVWHHVFGRGIVATPDDFGVMGAAPTHPELLDALARDFVADGWSTKRLLRRLLLSDAFARSSDTTDQQRTLDPDNRFLARASVRRLEAEAVRDALLFVSGSLDETRFGPSVPVHLTPFMNGRGRPGESGPLDGANRRSIYQAVRRNFLPPLLTVFDLPNPAGCAGRRNVSNVPAQALALMNDPFVALCAERAGERARTEPGDDGEKVRRLWLRTLGREPTPDELAGALAFVASPELSDVAAAWADLAHTLFGLEDFLWLR
jgi:hypothetical protein